MCYILRSLRLFILFRFSLLSPQLFPTPIHNMAPSLSGNTVSLKFLHLSAAKKAGATPTEQRAQSNQALPAAKAKVQEPVDPVALTSTLRTSTLPYVRACSLVLLLLIFGQFRYHGIFVPSVSNLLVGLANAQSMRWIPRTPQVKDL